jgi:uncharacterized protein YgbK (DUF1537 family)
MAKSAELKLSFYGDDITGSTDAMEALVLAGVPTVLFLEPPTLEQVSEKFPHIQAVGLAGMSRTMTPTEMEASLPGAFGSLKELGAPITHYKVCSTFDSSPVVGSIGRATEIGMEVFKSTIVPVAVGAPKLKRFVVFGNHFATIGDHTYRLDRHPVMSKHPITPMDESDLRLHLGKQTAKKIGLLDVRHLAVPDAEIDSYLQKQIDDGVEIIILDTLDRSHLKKVGRLLWTLGQQHQTFVVGSSGVEFAMAELWQEEGLIQPPHGFTLPGPVETIVAISGSASPWTASQIQWALENGFQGIQMDSTCLIDERTQEAERSRLVDQAVQFISNGQSVLLYSALGPDDPKISSTKNQIKTSGLSPSAIGEILGTQQGLVLKDILAKTGLRRAAVAGGDTCGHVLKQLSIYVLEFIIPLGTAAPLCRASSSNPQLDGMEIALKGGQLGEVNFFGSVLKGNQE